MPVRPPPLNGRPDPWVDEVEDPAARSFHPLTREEAQALRAKEPSLNPWRVIGAQVLVGVLSSALIGLVFSSMGIMWSVLYGAATEVVPGA